MCLSILTLNMHISISAFAEFESPEIVLLAEGLLARSAGHLPPEAPVAIVAQTPRTSLGLQIQTILLQIRKDVNVVAKIIFIELSVVLQFPDIITSAKLV
jgi:hypothetical protein